MAPKPHPATLNAPTILKQLSVALLATGLAVWAVILPAPVPAVPAPAFNAPQLAGINTGPVANWFGGSALRVKVQVSGIMTASNGNGTALLSINGQAPQAFRTGQELAPGVLLHSVNAHAITIDHDGELLKVPAAEITPAVSGFIPVPGIKAP
jgi:general secretion pathway protein C